MLPDSSNSLTLDNLQSLLGWCAVINTALLLWWFILLRLAHDAVYRLHRRWFELTTSEFDRIHYGSMAIFKLAIWLFNITPWLALLIMR